MTCQKSLSRRVPSRRNIFHLDSVSSHWRLFPLLLRGHMANSLWHHPWLWCSSFTACLVVWGTYHGPEHGQAQAISHILWHYTLTRCVPLYWPIGIKCCNGRITPHALISLSISCNPKQESSVVKYGFISVVIISDYISGYTICHTAHHHM